MDTNRYVIFAPFVGSALARISHRTGPVNEDIERK